MIVEIASDSSRDYFVSLSINSVYSADMARKVPVVNEIGKRRLSERRRLPMTDIHRLVEGRSQ